MRLLSMEQYEALVQVGQIMRLEDMRLGMQAINAAMGKNVRTNIYSIDRKLGILRQGHVSEEQLAEAELDATFGRSLGPLSDNALQSLGFDKL